MVTQVEIARRVGLDVSSVNKILNHRPGSVFRKETVRKVFKVARELGYDFSKLKYQHRRGAPRKDLAVDLEVSIYKKDGSLFDRGKAVMRNVSLTGTLLSGLMLPERKLPAEPYTVGIRLLEGPLRDLEILGEPVRFVHGGEALNMAIRFLGTEAAKAEKLRKTV
jgi:transcriptional regulator with XRE-family HTH domain